MPSTIDGSGTEDKSVEQASMAKGKRRAKTRGAEIAAVVNSPDTLSQDPNQSDPKPESIPGVSSSITSLPPRLATKAPSLVHRSPRSRTTSRDVSPYPRSRPSTPNRSSTPNISSSRRASSSSLSAAATVTAPPPRRSQRTLAKGPERPRGPPELEAALAIAIRNLESDIYTWWCANYKPGNPIPTTAYLKARSPRIRKAAEAVDEADRLLNEAVYGKPKRLKTGKKAQPPPERSCEPTSATPETTLERLELNSQGSPSLQSISSSELDNGI